VQACSSILLLVEEGAIYGSRALLHISIVLCGSWLCSVQSMPALLRALGLSAEHSDDASWWPLNGSLSSSRRGTPRGGVLPFGGS